MSALGTTIKVYPGKSVEERAKAQKRADKTGKPVSLLMPFYKQLKSGRTKMVWTTYDTVYPSKIPNGRMVPARIRHKGKTYPGKVKRVNGKVKIFVTPQVASKINPEHKYTIADIRSANKSAGYHFFDRSSMKFFNSKVFPAVYQGSGGVFFVTSETMEPSIPSLKNYHVRKFVPETSNIQSIDQYKSLENAKTAARMKARV